MTDARSPARLYAALLGELDGVRLLSGGRLAFADVASGLAVGYTCTAMRWRPERGPDPRWPPLLEAIRREC